LKITSNIKAIIIIFLSSLLKMAYVILLYKNGINEMQIDHSCAIYRYYEIKFLNFHLSLGYDKYIIKYFQDNYKLLMNICMQAFAYYYSPIILHSPKLCLCKKKNNWALAVSYEGTEYISQSFINDIFENIVMSLYSTTKYKFDDIYKDTTKSLLTYDNKSILIFEKDIFYRKPQSVLCTLKDLEEQMPLIYDSLIIRINNEYQLKTTDISIIGNNIIPEVIRLDDYYNKFICHTDLLKK
jgi:hypothetical protein